MIEEAVVILVLACVLALVNMRSRSQAMSRLYKWGRENHLWISEVEERWVMRGPFFFTTTIGQRVYRITVKYAADDYRRAWVHIGGIIRGMFSSTVDVRWDIDTQPIMPPPPLHEFRKESARSVHA